MPRLTARLYTLFLTQATIAVTVTAPLDGAVVATADVAVSWTFSPGTQASYRILVFTDATEATIKYDSGVIASGGQSATIPAGALDDLTNYFLRVQIVTTTGQAGESDQIAFSTAFTPSVNITGTAVALIGGNCPPAQDPTDLPCLVVTWDEVVPGAGETFIQYDVKRRVAGETVWTRIGVITAIATTTFTDCNVAAFRTYEYSVVWQAQTAAGVLVSSDPSPPPFGEQQFDHAFFHDVATPANFMRFESLASNVELVQDVDVRTVWGRQQPIAHVGESEFHVVSVDGLPAVFRGGQWTDLAALVTRQRIDGAVICARLGRAGELFFCQLLRQEKRQGEKTFVPRTEFNEVFFDEAV